MKDEYNEFLEEEGFEEKKSNLGLIIGIASGAVAVIAGIVVGCIFLFGNNTDDCKGHVDADDDYKCDNCGENFDDGDEAVIAATVPVRFTVKVKDGAVLSGIKFTVTKGKNSTELITDANGGASASLQVSSGETDVYSVSYDAETLPQYHIASTYEFTVAESGNDIILEILDNTPDGTKEKPFFIGEEFVTITAPAGREVFYSVHGNEEAYLELRAEGIKVIREEAVLTPDGGVIVLEFGDVSVNEAFIFSVKNEGSADIDVEIELVFPVGSRENPIDLTSEDSLIYFKDPASTDSAPIADIVFDGASAHFKWVANESGILVITTSNSKSNISMTNVTTAAVSNQTSGGKATYITASVGDVIIIAVSASEVDPVTNKITPAYDEMIDLSLKTYTGAESDPLPVLADKIGITIAPGASFTFSYSFTEKRDIYISDSDITLKIGDILETPDKELGIILVEKIVGEGTFTITNTSSDKNGVDIEFQESKS